MICSYVIVTSWFCKLPFHFVHCFPPGIEVFYSLQAVHSFIENIYLLRTFAHTYNTIIIITIIVTMTT